jgi:hypothetical protein
MVKRGTREEGRSEELGEKRKGRREGQKRRKKGRNTSSAPLCKILDPPLPVSQTK